MAKRLRPPSLDGPGATNKDDYEVGYGKPPVHTRFKPGQSGNPRGRPKGAKNRKKNIPALNEERMKTVVLEEAYRTIGVRDGDRLVEIPVIQAVIRSIALNAAKGNQRAQRDFATLVQWVERENKALHDEWLNTAIEYKADWERELRRCKELGIEAPDPLPHPDDIVINLNTGRVEIHGPMTAEEEKMWDMFCERKLECDKSIAELEELAAKDPENRHIQDDLQHERKIRAIITDRIGDWPRRLE